VLKRAQLGAAVSDLLLERDDPALIYRLASSEEVHFSDVGIVKLVYAAKNDKKLAAIVLRRKDLPPEMLPFLQMADA
jgi:predicted nucleic acid-binding protein